MERFPVWACAVMAGIGAWIAWASAMAPLVSARLREQAGHPDEPSGRSALAQSLRRTAEDRAGRADRPAARLLGFVSGIALFAMGVYGLLFR